MGEISIAWSILFFSVLINIFLVVQMRDDFTSYCKSLSEMSKFSNDIIQLQHRFFQSVIEELRSVLK